MYVYRKRSDKKVSLARNKVREYKEERICPGCRGTLELSETGKDRATYVCSKCNAICTFTSYPEKQNKDTKLGLITLRDKSPTLEKSNSVGNNNSVQNIEEELEIIRKAMKDLRLLMFDYLDRVKRKSTRTIEPYKLTVDGSGNPILFGYCSEAESIRMFKIRRMANISIQEFSFIPRWEILDKIDGKKKD